MCPDYHTMQHKVKAQVTFNFLSLTIKRCFRSKGVFKKCIYCTMHCILQNN